MATSLYDLSVPTFLQTVRAIGGVPARAASHCASTGTDPDDLVEARLFDDMAPFHFQIEAVSADKRDFIGHDVGYQVPEGAHTLVNRDPAPVPNRFEPDYKLHLDLHRDSAEASRPR